MDAWLELLTLGMSPAQRKVAINFMWRLGVTIHIAMACGWLSAIGYSPFVQATDLKEVRNEVQAVRDDQVSASVELLESRIFDTFTRQCAANTPEGKRYYAEKVQDLKLRYYRLTKRDYPRLPECDRIQ